mmetsp:Transcript_36033/g.94730  ORF Transcript_36033/g.94730 Transcript_36033/m.94730 type:complete len:108 (-) Transcript_36033:306-629(-)
MTRELNIMCNVISLSRTCLMTFRNQVLSGGTVLKGATLLEHTLLLAGDIADAYSVWQGWPAEMVVAPPSPRSAPPCIQTASLVCFSEPSGTNNTCNEDNSDRWCWKP